MLARAGAATWNMARTDAPGATEANAAEPEARAVHPAGSDAVSRTFSSAAADVISA